MYAIVISPMSSLIAAAVLIGVSVRVALLLHQRKQIFSRREHLDG